ncbi:hypothetical protein [Actinoplanes sp. NPDC020271]|uniref:hypothetical protein n=1 Tax=Actinoplanes sp. NPDC020271 TaxID=3363896 RepID=UPI0037907237
MSAGAGPPAGFGEMIPVGDAQQTAGSAQLVAGSGAHPQRDQAPPLGRRDGRRGSGEDFVVGMRVDHEDTVACITMNRGLGEL